MGFTKYVECFFKNATQYTVFAIAKYVWILYNYHGYVYAWQGLLRFPERIKICHEKIVKGNVVGTVSAAGKSKEFDAFECCL